MKREIKELKRIARGNLQGNYLGLIRAFVFCNLIVSLVETPFSMMTNEVTFSTQNLIYYAAMILITIASVVLTVGQYCLHLRIARNGKIHLSELFYPAKHDANRLILTEVFLWVIEFLAISPVFVAGAIVLFHEDITMYIIALGLCILGAILFVFAEITFGLTYFALIDNEELGISASLKKALSLINGHKKRFLYLQASFLGMYLLVLFTFGLGILWVQPYVMQTTTLFYMDITGELDEVLEARRKTEPTPEPVVFDTYA